MSSANPAGHLCRRLSHVRADRYSSLYSRVLRSRPATLIRGALIDDHTSGEVRVGVTFSFQRPQYVKPDLPRTEIDEYRDHTIPQPRRR